MKHIINFDAFDGPNEYAFLSNFYKGEPIVVFDATWPTGEHAYQGMKCLESLDRETIRTAKTPGIAKRLGRSITLRPAWESKKYDVMAAVLRAKFTLDRKEGMLLLETGNVLLTEGTNWNDRVWGVDGHDLSSPGRNWLGTLLMARRAELRAERIYGTAHMTGQYNAEFVE